MASIFDGQPKGIYRPFSTSGQRIHKPKTVNKDTSASENRRANEAVSANCLPPCRILASPMVGCCFVRFVYVEWLFGTMVGMVS